MNAERFFTTHRLLVIYGAAIVGGATILAGFIGLPARTQVLETKQAEDDRMRPEIVRRVRFLTCTQLDTAQDKAAVNNRCSSHLTDLP